MLIDELVSFCDEEYQNSECFPCSAKVMCERECGYNCKDCLDDIHFHHHTYRDEYNCERLLDYYIYKTFEDKGKIGLVMQVENYEVYALTWDDVFKSFELRHAPLLKRLNYDREKLAKELMKEIENEEGRDKVNALTNIAIGKIGDVS